jgi:hypothetical protein
VLCFCQAENLEHGRSRSFPWYGYKTSREQLCKIRPRPAIIPPWPAVLPAGKPQWRILCQQAVSFNVFLPLSAGWVSMGLISAADLLHWRAHPDALGPDKWDGGIFSGGAFVHENGTAWPTKTGKGQGLALRESRKTGICNTSRRTESCHC